MIKGKELILMVRALSHEKDIPEKEILDAVEKALATAVRKHLGVDADIKVSIDNQKGIFDIKRYWDVVATEEDIVDPHQQILLSIAKTQFNREDISAGEKVDETLSILPGGELGRIAAQVFKQGIMENVRKAERLKEVSVYTPKIDQLFTGVVKAIKRDHAILEVNGVETCLWREEMLPRDSLHIGDKLRVCLYEVRYEPRGPQLFVSRTHSQMLLELFKLEVPEVSEEIIEIRAIARDPGSRAKVAVSSNDHRFDPVGTCVGIRGVRVQAISNELGGERVDVILWDDSPAQLVINAMAPAEVLSLMMDEDKHAIDVIVKEEQLSQAIGRSGQNVRLASELTGWQLNILTNEEAENKQKKEADSLVELFKAALDVDDDVALVLVNEGFSSLEEVAYVAHEEMLDIEGFDEEIAKELQERATKALESQPAKKQPVDQALLALPHMTDELVKILNKHEIHCRDDIAELSVDDLVEVSGIDEHKAAEIIIAARAHWFE